MKQYFILTKYHDQGEQVINKLNSLCRFSIDRLYDHGYWQLKNYYAWSKYSGDQYNQEAALRKWFIDETI